MKKLESNENIELEVCLQQQIENTHTTYNLLDVNLIKQNSKKVFKILLSNIKEDYKNNPNDSNKEQDFILETFLNQMKTVYLKEEHKDKFILVGYKDLEVESNLCTTCTDTQICNSCNTWSNLMTRNTLNKKKDIRRFEVFFRFNQGNCEEDEEYEMMFNDITKFKQLEEEKSAELNFKTEFLSKVAHEFKNPILCISELVNEFIKFLK